MNRLHDWLIAVKSEGSTLGLSRVTEDIDIQPHRGTKRNSECGGKRKRGERPAHPPPYCTYTTFCPFFDVHRSNKQRWITAMVPSEAKTSLEQVIENDGEFFVVVRLTT